MESGLHRHAGCDQYGELRPASGSGRSFTPRSSTPITASSGATRQSSSTIRRRAARRAGRRSSLRRTRRSSACSRPASRRSTESYAASLAALSDDCEDGHRARKSHGSCARRIERGIAWGTEVAQTVLAWRATDGFGGSYPPFTGGTAVGQWRPTPPAVRRMSAQGLAFTSMFALVSNTQFEPGPPRSLTSATYSDDFNAVKALGRSTGSTRTEDQTALALFLGGQRQRPLESGREPDCAGQPLVHVRRQPAARGPEHRDGRHGVHDLERQAILRLPFPTK